jgi:hypothetical protein
MAGKTGQGDIAARALAVLDDPEREFASSPFVRLEVLPKAIFHKNADEAEFYETFFQCVSRWATNLDDLTAAAWNEAAVHGLAAMDALHVAAAVQVNAAELITTEHTTKPIHRTRSCQVISIHKEP